MEVLTCQSPTPAAEQDRARATAPQAPNAHLERMHLYEPRYSRTPQVPRWRYLEGGPSRCPYLHAARCLRVAKHTCALPHRHLATSTFNVPVLLDTHCLSFPAPSLPPGHPQVALAGGGAPQPGAGGGAGGAAPPGQQGRRREGGLVRAAVHAQATAPGPGRGEGHLAADPTGWWWC